MFLKNIKLYNFRNYNNIEINLNPKINIFYGNNGQGKTNFLESIYFMAITKSHRSFIDKFIINENKEECSVIGTIFQTNGENKYKIIINNKKKQAFINNEKISSVSEYISKINVIIFYPDDLEIIKGSPNLRRRFLNVEMGQLNSRFIVLLSEYNNILKQRNNILKTSLKNKIDQEYLEILTKFLIDKGSQIIFERNLFLKEIENKAKIIFEKISDKKNLNIKYITSLNLDNYEIDTIKKEYEMKIFQSKKQEEKLGTTIVGPHKDDFEIFAEFGSLKNFGSQGQQRMGILSLKIAEIEMFYEKTREYPILLLDDVFSELDINKKINLLEYLDKNIQTIITTTEIDNIPQSIISGAKIFRVDKEQIIETEEVE
jgi:DNA replication and repair protein RecF